MKVIVIGLDSWVDMDDEVRRYEDDLKVIYLGDLMYGANNYDRANGNKEGLMRKIINLCWGHWMWDARGACKCKWPVDIVVWSTEENQGLGSSVLVALMAECDSHGCSSWGKTNRVRKQNSQEATLENSNIKGVDVQQQQQQKKTAKEANEKQEKKSVLGVKKKKVRRSMKQ